MYYRLAPFIYCLISFLHPHLIPPHYSHLPNWIKRLLDVSQRGFIVCVCDSDV